jgi:hypothetical protein
VTRAWVILAAVLGVAACTGTIATGPEGEASGPGGSSPSSSPGGGAGAGPAGENCVPQGRNDEIRLKLAKACAGCHIVGNKPFFASLEAFENGLVYDSRYVTPGKPEDSLLVKMLKGNAPGSYPQMPPGELYQKFVSDGRVSLSVTDVEGWIRNLPPPPDRLAEPSPEHFTVRRLTAEEMVLGLMDQLGLAVEDFVDTGRPTWRDESWVVRGGNLFVWPVDWAPGISKAYGSDSRSLERFETLGGPVTLEYRKRDRDLGPGALQTLVQMSQAWCKLAVSKPGNKAVLKDVSLTDRSTSAADAIKRNIRALYIRMLGAVPAADEIDDVYTQVYLPYEAENTRAAWTAVCASFVRHPLWVTF